MQNSQIINRKLLCYDKIDSTNEEAKRQISKGASEGLVIIAKEQTAGKGKPGSSWFSAPNLGLYMSIVIKPYKDQNKLSGITQFAAMAVIKAIKSTTGLEAVIKPPNDVLLDQKKVCGILVERVAKGEVIVGIGINLDHSPTDFLPELQKTATSLFIETKKKIDILDVLLDCFNQEYLAYLSNI